MRKDAVCASRCYGLISQRRSEEGKNVQLCVFCTPILSLVDDSQLYNGRRVDGSPVSWGQLVSIMNIGKEMFDENIDIKVKEEKKIVSCDQRK